MGTIALIGLGSNLGDRKAILDSTCARLQETPELIVRSVSTYHETQPVGGPAGQGPFLNAAAALETTLGPVSLLRRLQEIEDCAGRTRTDRWGERTLDLDLLLFGNEIVVMSELRVPHPRMCARRFVLVPLEEIAPHHRHPLTGRSIRELRANVDRRPSYLALQGWWVAPEKREALAQIVEKLNTFCWSQHDLEELLTEENREPFGGLEKTLGFLSSPTNSSPTDQWVVTDFTIAELIAAATQRWGPIAQAQIGSLVRRLSAHQLDLLEPTFIVDGRVPTDHCPEAEAFLRSTPRLGLESELPEQQVSEILAACAATRA
jgi:2-amino-4-hydroxy-6-hydroxymethyldihydropteridine diphosphokinase